MEKLWPLAFIIQSSSQGSVMGCHARAPHSRVMLPDCWWLLRQLVLPLDMLGMSRGRYADVLGQQERRQWTSLSHGDSFHRRERAQAPLLVPLVRT